MTIRQLGVMSVAKMMGALYGLIGLIAGAFFALFAILGAGLAASQDGGAGAGIFGAMFGVGSIILFPIFYGVAGFIAGAITAFLYNIVAGFVGGIEIETG